MKVVIQMTKYREIATSCDVSRNFIARVCKRAAELNIQWPLELIVTVKDLKEMLFSQEAAVVSGKRLPDFEYFVSV